MNRLSRQLRAFHRDPRGFAAAEAILLACVLGAICLAVGLLLRQGAATAAARIDHEIATGAPGR